VRPELAGRFQVRKARWLAERPRSYKDQGDWLLERLLEGNAPGKHPERWVRCHDYAAVILWLREKGLLLKGKVALSGTGRRYIKGLCELHPDGVPERKPFQVRVGAIATGSKVMEDPDIFDEAPLGPNQERRSP